MINFVECGNNLTGNAYKILVRKPEGKILPLKAVRRSKNNIKVCFK